MSILTALFTILIRPLELLFEVIFAFTYRVLPNPGICLLIMSLLINFLVLPLYNRADMLQKQTRETEEKLGPMIAHIKKYFKGDERIMMLQTYYDQNHYHPLSALKSSISLILQIPFFMAAYRFLSNLPLLQGASLGPIKDLSLPDHLIVIGGITLNLLPIAMTIINVVSCEIYTKGQPFKSKITLYAMALFFLVFLYTCPSGLVLYWTLNNVFSLVKNIFLKLKRPGFVLCVVCAVTGLGLAFGALVAKKDFSSHQFLFLLLVGIALMVPLGVSLILRKVKIDFKPATAVEKMIFWFSAVYLSVLVGVLIPSAVISSSPDEFVDRVLMHNPVRFIEYAICIALGTFVVWLGMFFLLSSDKSKRVFAGVVFVMCIVGTVNYLAFGTNLGDISTDLQISDGLVFAKAEILLNIAVVVLCSVMMFIIYMHLPKMARFVVLAGSLAILGLGFYNVKIVNDKFDDMQFFYDDGDEVATIQLSTTGQNVIVMMLDRSIGGFVPFIMNERPDLLEAFDGFTYFHNTISFGPHTNFGSGPLWGGYDYTPSAMNARDDLLLVDKQNEALTVLPRLFSENGYYTTVFDPPFANYSWNVDLSIYDDYPDIHAYRAEGLFNDFDSDIAVNAEENRDRNFFFYSLMRVCPLVVQESLYNNGKYNSLDVHYGGSTDDAEERETLLTPQEHDGMSIATGIDEEFLDGYTTLNAFPYITQYTDNPNGSFFIMCTEMTHGESILQEPEYIPVQNVDNTEYDATHMDRFTLDNGLEVDVHRYGQMAHYQINMSAFLVLADWFRELQANGVWDNTRIILVSDHGHYQQQFSDLILFDGTLDAEGLYALLMFKDFGSTGFVMSDEFMTIADAPALAVQGVIDNPVNPFTGNIINMDGKIGGVDVFNSDDYRPQDNHGYQFNPGPWYHVHDDIFNPDNWEYLGEY